MTGKEYFLDNYSRIIPPKRRVTVGYAIDRGLLAMVYDLDTKQFIEEVHYKAIPGKQFDFALAVEEMNSAFCEKYDVQKSLAQTP